MNRFVLNTRYPEMAASAVCIDRMAKFLRASGREVTLNDWNHYEKYDVVIFMTYDSEVEKAREANPNILVGIGDPKITYAEEARKADFLLVSSVEQQDLLFSVNPNTFIYYMFPDVAPVKKLHVDKKEIIIGYHGNKTHLNSLYPIITSALERLASDFKIEFWAMYNFKSLGKWSYGLPDKSKVTVRHLPWSNENYHKLLSQADIGIVPNTTLPHLYRPKSHLRPFVSKVFSLHEDDYVTRFKYSSNPGRIYVFAQLGIPVVADFYPSAAQFIEHENRGLLAHSADGWYRALKTLSNSAELRQKYSDNLFQYCNGHVSPSHTFAKLMDYLDELKSRRTTASTIIVTPRKPKAFIWRDLTKEFFKSHFRITAFLYIRLRRLLPIST